jgi:hypothetical protein
MMPKDGEGKIIFAAFVAIAALTVAVLVFGVAGLIAAFSDGGRCR